MIRISVSLVSPLAVTIVALGLAVTTVSADPFSGERLARQWCASCHVVAPDQKQANTDAPAFEAIARMPGLDRNKIAFFLLDPHPKMPNMSLSRNEATDLADYIVKLGAAH